MTGAALTWSSSRAAVASVEASGLVTAASNGAATITAAAGVVSGTTAVTVAQVAGSVVVTPVADTVALADTLADTRCGWRPRCYLHPGRGRNEPALPRRCERSASRISSGFKPGKSVRISASVIPEARYSRIIVHRDAESPNARLPTSLVRL